MAAGGWSPDNDPSFAELVGTNGSELVRANSLALYEGGKLVFGTEPNGESAGLVKPSDAPNTPSSSSSRQSSQQSTNTPPSDPVADKGGLRVTVNQQQSSGNGNTIQFTIELQNGTGTAIDLSSLEIDYFFTADGKSGLNFWCDHAATSGSGYTALTESVKGEFSSASGDNCDTKCAVKFGVGTLAAGDTLTAQIRITPDDWTEFDLGNDFSAGNAERLCIISDGNVIFGTKP